MKDHDTVKELSYEFFDKVDDKYEANQAKAAANLASIFCRPAEIQPFSISSVAANKKI